MNLPWIEIPPGSVVMGKDGYPWDVRDVGGPDPGKQAGTVKVTMYREGRGEVIGHPPAGAVMEVVSCPTQPNTEDAVKLLREILGAEVAECGWCSGDPGAECICDVNCGRKGCVNF